MLLDRLVGQARQDQQDLRQILALQARQDHVAQQVGRGRQDLWGRAATRDVLALLVLLDFLEPL